MEFVTPLGTVTVTVQGDKVVCKHDNATQKIRITGRTHCGGPFSESFGHWLEAGKKETTFDLPLPASIPDQAGVHLLIELRSEDGDTFDHGDVRFRKSAAELRDEYAREVSQRRADDHDGSIQADW